MAVGTKRLSGKLVGTSMRSKDFAVAAGGCCRRPVCPVSPVRPVSPDFSGFLGLSGKLVGTSMRSKTTARPGGLLNFPRTIISKNKTFGFRFNGKLHVVSTQTPSLQAAVVAAAGNGQAIQLLAFTMAMI